ncbi:MAG: UbiA family prenyltransferase [Candidatus Diapherotrites archaeon]|nr:UbiA family prenyltransferase [Candidatus Diapherotrites archaeon]
MGLKDYLLIIRPLNCFIASLGVMAGAFVSKSSSLLSLELISAMSVAFFVCAGGQTINDYFDYSIDKKKNKFLSIKKENLFYYSILLFFLGNLIALFVGLVPFLISFTSTVLLIVYSSFMNKIKFFGNIVVSYNTGATFILGASRFGNYAMPFIFATCAFFATLGREIIKDFEDMGIDKKHKVTLPMLDKNLATVLIFFSYVVCFCLALFVWILGFTKSLVYFLLVFFAGIFLYNALNEFKKNNYSKSQFLSKYAMLLAMFGFIFSVIL